MLEIKEICFKRNNKIILDHITLQLHDDKFYVITGPNGSGKSTLAKIVMGLEQPDSGTILLNGQDITRKSVDERAKMGLAFAFQQPVRFKGITVLDLLSYASNEKLDRQKACAILTKVGLCAKEYVDREVNASLSGGELKRIEIATVLARKPSVAIFDEPEAGIDLWSFQNLTNVFAKLQQENKITTLVISHQERILNIADNIILLEKGQIKKMGSKEDVLPNILRKAKCCAKGRDKDE